MSDDRRKDLICEAAEATRVRQQADKAAQASQSEASFHKEMADQAREKEDRAYIALDRYDRNQKHEPAL